MRIWLSLADYAQSDAVGKVNAIGLGWTAISTPLPPFAVVVLLDIDWTETNEPHNVKCELLNADGEQVLIPGPVGPQPLLFEANIEAGRPPGAIHGSTSRVPFTVNVGGGVSLPPGRYEWRASVEGFDEVVAVESFVVRAPTAGSPTMLGEPPRP